MPTADQLQPPVPNRLEPIYQDAFMAMNQGFSLLDIQFDGQGQAYDIIIRDANPAQRRIDGVQALIGKGVKEFLPDIDMKWIERYAQVARSGQSAQFEDWSQANQRWYEVEASSVGGAGSSLVAIIYTDITHRRQLEEALQQNQELNAFLLQLSDALRPVEDPIAIQQTAMNVLGEYMAVNRAYYTEAQSDDDTLVTRTGYFKGVTSMVGSMKISDFDPDLRQTYLAGKSVVVNDVFADLTLTESGRASFESIQFRAGIGLPLVKQGRLVAIVTVHQSSPRVWREQEVALLQEVAERTWAAVERAKAEEDLRRQQERTRIAVEAAQMGTWEWNLLTNEVYWNEQHFWLFGLEPHQQPLTPDEFTSHVHPDDLDRLLAQLQQTIREKVVYDAEFRAVRQDGTIRWMSGYGRVTAETDGHSTRLSGVMFDINDRKQDQEALRRQQEQLRIVLESITDHALITTDTQRIITSWNPGAEHLFGFTAEEALGQPEDILFTPEDRAAGTPRQEMETARQQGRVADERYHLRKDGSQFYVSGVQSPLYDGAGLLLGYVKVAHDLTQRRQMEQALRDADRRKDEFLATLAHELRNPLAPIRNTLQLLNLTADTTETVSSAVAMMSRQVDQLVRLIDDLLDVSRINRGKIQLRLEPIELGDVVRQAGEATRPLYQAGERELTISLPQAPLYVQGDTTRLIQVISNLLNNAAKFTTEGGKVHLTVDRAGDESDGPTALLRVVDNGIGIAADQLERIFELFTQADNGLERSHNGLGLGLTLVRQLVELHGGEVAVNSDGLGQGSEFTVRLPVLAQSPQRPPASSTGTKQPTAGRRILVVDDNPDAALTLAMLLKLKGHQVHIRHNGQEGLAAAESLQPEVILLDIGMPGLNGYDTCRLIRQQRWGQSMVLIALTGFGQEEDKRLSQEAGFNAHLVKPVDLGALIELVATLPGSTKGTRPSD